MIGQLPIKISLEGWWSPVMEALLTALHNPQHPVVNWSPHDHDRVAEPFLGGGLSEETIGPPLQRYLYQLARPVLTVGGEAPSMHLYYNLHGLRRIYYPLEKPVFTPEQQVLYESAAERLLPDPDVIIYGFQPIPAQGSFSALAAQYEWLYDGDNTDIPVFKVNFGDTFPTVTAALQEILGLIHHHYHSA